MWEREKTNRTLIRLDDKMCEDLLPLDKTGRMLAEAVGVLRDGDVSEQRSSLVFGMKDRIEGIGAFHR